MLQNPGRHTLDVLPVDLGEGLAERLVEWEASAVGNRHRREVSVVRLGERGWIVRLAERGWFAIRSGRAAIFEVVGPDFGIDKVGVRGARLGPLRRFALGRLDKRLTIERIERKNVLAAGGGSVVVLRPERSNLAVSAECAASSSSLSNSASLAFRLDG
jgi:hypothetical protein